MAIREYERALRKEKAFVQGRVNLGNARLAKKEYGKAEEEYRKALEGRPGDPEATNNLAWAAVFSGGRAGEGAGGPPPPAAPPLVQWNHGARLVYRNRPWGGLPPRDDAPGGRVTGAIPCSHPLTRIFGSTITPRTCGSGPAAAERGLWTQA